ncbi:MAG: helix-turn-helix domain-containing protein, partial [Clostridia bacterium]|nr:helix-turn-helix domain-containing protein [Clostridia bacterium]
MLLSKFSESLTELMLTKNISSQELADTLGIERSTISRYKRGAKLPSLENLILLANYFNCTTDYLLGIKDENHKKVFKSCPPFSERFPLLLKECQTSQYK